MINDRPILPSLAKLVTYKWVGFTQTWREFANQATHPPDAATITYHLGSLVGIHKRWPNWRKICVKYAVNVHWWNLLALKRIFKTCSISLAPTPVSWLVTLSDCHTAATEHTFYIGEVNLAQKIELNGRNLFERRLPGFTKSDRVWRVEIEIIMGISTKDKKRRHPWNLPTMQATNHLHTLLRSSHLLMLSHDQWPHHSFLFSFINVSDMVT